MSDIEIPQTCVLETEFVEPPAFAVCPMGGQCAQTLV